MQKMLPELGFPRESVVFLSGIGCSSRFSVIFLEHGKAMRFGKMMEKGIRLNKLTPEVVNVADVDKGQLLVHDECATEPTLAYFLSRMGPPDFPTPVGVFRAVQKPVYDQQLMAQVHNARENSSPDLNVLYRQGETWAVPPTALEGTLCPVCDHLNLPGADECEICLSSLTNEEEAVAAAQAAIRRSLRDDTVELLSPSQTVSIEDTMSVAEALEIMRDKNIGCLLVTAANGELSGVFTERDVLCRVGFEEPDLSGIMVNEVMTPNPETVKPNRPLVHAVHLMVVGDLCYLPLLDEAGYPTGIVDSRVLVDYIASLVMK